LLTYEYCNTSIVYTRIEKKIHRDKSQKMIKKLIGKKIKKAVK